MVEAGRVAVITMKLSLFWPSDLEVWFVQIEAQFSTIGITAHKTKFVFIVSSLTFLT